MSATRARQLAVEGAQRRVLETLRTNVDAPATARRVLIVAIAAALFAATFAARLAVHDPNALLANFYVVPIAMLAIEFGTRAGVCSAILALGLVFLWTAIETVRIGVLGYTSRGAALLVAGAVIGVFSERLRHDIAARQRAQRSLALYTDELERANGQLAQSVERLEAFAAIARGVGGETDLDRVLSLILAQGREILAARRLLVCLPEGAELLVVTGDQSPAPLALRVALGKSAAGEVLRRSEPIRLSAADDDGLLRVLNPPASAALLVPITFRGETLGVLAGVDREDGGEFGDEDEQLLLSIAASAATALATARSVAAARLALSLQAAEEARARWARELHDQTLQGLSGARMLLAAGLSRDDPDALRGVAEAVDAHLADELRGLRDLITELRPAALDDLGLGPAIESLARRQAASSGFELELRIELAGSSRPRETESAIYRIVQEAINNVIKHAHASHVALQVIQSAQRVEISISDDGRGFSPASVREGFGLTGMRERAVLLGGRLSLSSADGGPTSVTAVLPLAA